MGTGGPGLKTPTPSNYPLDNSQRKNKDGVRVVEAAPAKAFLARCHASLEASRAFAQEETAAMKADVPGHHGYRTFLGHLEGSTCQRTPRSAAGAEPTEYFEKNQRGHSLFLAG
jgi:hypothetical protein